MVYKCVQVTCSVKSQTAHQVHPQSRADNPLTKKATQTDQATTTDQAKSAERGIQTDPIW